MMKVKKRYSVQRGTSEGADGQRGDGIELTKELLKRCSAMLSMSHIVAKVRC